MPGELLVQFSSACESQSSKAVSLESQYSAWGLKTERCVSQNLNVWLFSFNENAITESSLAAMISKEKSVIVAQPNRKLELRETFPDDLYFPDQWNLHNTGQYSGVEDADIDAPEAWDYSTGGETIFGDTIVMAIIDDGFDLNHDDLNFFKNYDEIPGNGIDDDNNGFIDDFDGWNAYSHNGNVRLRDHGTHVSGIAGAIGNNGIGVSGVTWGGRILPISGTEQVEATLVECYDYALTMRKLYDSTNGEMGAFVVSTNLSWGVNNGNPDDFPIWCAMYDSLGAYGIISAGATANANYNIDETMDMPTACDSPYLITVTNTTKDDEKHISAGYGATTIDLGAPGTSVYNTRQGNSYGFKSGTSMSCPHITASIALLFSVADEELMTRYHNDPGNICKIFRDAILMTTDTLETLVDVSTTGGRLNLHKAVEYIIDAPQAAELSFDKDSLVICVAPGERADTSIILTNMSDFAATTDVFNDPGVDWLTLSIPADTIQPGETMEIGCWFDAVLLSEDEYRTNIVAMTSGAQTEMPVLFSVFDGLGVNDLSKMNISIRNNPTLNKEIVMDVSGDPKNLTVKVISIAGKTIFNSEHQNSDYGNTLQIPVSESGVYIVSVYDENGNSFIKKVIVK